MKLDEIFFEFKLENYGYPGSWKDNRGKSARTLLFRAPCPDNLNEHTILFFPITFF
jgi:hypothetical protein